MPLFKVTSQQTLIIRSSALEFIRSRKQTVLETGQLTHSILSRMFILALFDWSVNRALCHNLLIKSLNIKSIGKIIVANIEMNYECILNMKK